MLFNVITQKVINFTGLLFGFNVDETLNLFSIRPKKGKYIPLFVSLPKQRQ